MDEVEKTVLGSSEEATPQTPTETSPTPESGNEDNQEKTQEEKDWKAEYETVSKRYSDSSREVSKFKETAEATQGELLSFVTQSRDIFERYVDSKTLSPEDKEYYMNIYDTQIAPTKGSTASDKAAAGVTGELETDSSPSTQPTVPAQRADPVRQSWMNRMDAEEREKIEKQYRATQEFFDAEENKSLPGNIQEAIKATAAMLDQEFGYEPQEALKAARKRLLEPESLKEEGYVEGIKDSMVGGISRGVTGGSAQPKEGIKLPARDEAFIQLEIDRKGLKGEEAERLREAYASRLAMKK